MSFVAVTLLDISMGLSVGVGFSLIVSLVRTQWCNVSSWANPLGTVQHNVCLQGWHRLERKVKSIILTYSALWLGHSCCF